MRSLRYVRQTRPAAAGLPAVDPVAFRPVAFRPAVFFIFFLLFFIDASLQAQINLVNPSFPEKESFTYVRNSDRGSEMVSVEMRLVGPSAAGETERPAAGSHYEYRMLSDSKDMLVKLSADTLLVFYSEVRLKNSHSTVFRTSEIVELNKPVGPGELLICDGNGLDVSLRGFPWKEYDQADLIFLNGSDKFKFGAKVEGRETLRLNGTTYECYKMQLSFGGFIGTFFPKSYFWYSVKEPHILVRAEAAGMMGEDAYEIELVSYTTSSD
ncbi:MAG: hypothetical protein SVR04_14315 [Spirochaetota bacterium]|nr:hypothetical protein [Spirochaetota bacterium]